MKARLGICLLVLSICVPLVAQNSIQFVGPKKENLRIQPNGTRIADLLGGSQIEVLERQGSWTKVQVTGWIWNASLVADRTRVEGYHIVASHILLAGIENAKAVLKRIEAGEDFKELARLHSIDPASKNKGGDLGVFGRGDFLPAFEEAAFKLEVGQVSEITKTRLGYHIIKRTR